MKENTGKKVNRTLFMTLIWLLIAILAMGGATYAWFTFSASTRVYDGAGTIGTLANLLISNDKNGPFDTTTDLKVKGSLAELLPVTTKDLSKFEYPGKTDRFGNPLEFEDVTDTIEKYAVVGTLYLLSEDKDCRLALYGPKCFFGDEKEFVEAARLGLRLTTSEGTYTYIIPLDDMDDYFAAGTENEPVAPKIFLGNLPADEVTTLDYYLYLEGTDEECKNQAQNRAAELQFYFAGF